MQTAGRAYSGSLYQAGAVLVFVAALVVVRANAEVGLNDDWSFVRTVYDLAASGHLQYNGWSAPLIGFQAYWAALFVKLFGFSFLVVRASSWVLTILTLPILWKLLRAINLTVDQAFFGLFVFLLSPLNLPCLATFMTDMPAFLLFATALFLALKAWNAATEPAAMWWIGLSTAVGLLSGSIRQVYWVAVFCFLIMLGVARARSLRVRILIAGCLVVTALFMAACSRWMAVQPYVPLENITESWRQFSATIIARRALEETVRNLVGATVFCLPFSIPLAWNEARRIPIKIHLVVIAIEAGMVYRLAQPLPWLGNTVTLFGVLLPGTVSIGDRPQALTPFLVDLIALLGVLSASYVLWMLVGWLRSLTWKQLIDFVQETQVGRFAALTVPFLLLYLCILAVRATAFGIFDRYLIPVVFVGGALMLSNDLMRGVTSRKLTWTAGALFALYALATTHDYFAEARAKLAATEQVLKAGHPRDTVLSGFEFDMWTEVERSKHVNNVWVRFPKDSYHETEDCNGDDEVQAWWRYMVPDIRARYVISISRLGDLQQPTEFPPVEYWRWLPPTKSRVYVEQLKPHDPPLTCKPGSGDDS